MAINKIIEYTDCKQLLHNTTYLTIPFETKVNKKFLENYFRREVTLQQKSNPASTKIPLKEPLIFVRREGHCTSDATFATTNAASIRTLQKALKSGKKN